MEGWKEAKDRNMAKKKARDMDTMQKGGVWTLAALGPALGPWHSSGGGAGHAIGN